MWDASATMIDVPLENAINMRSVWTAWFQFWGKRNIVNAQAKKTIKMQRHLVIAFCVPKVGGSKSLLDKWVIATEQNHLNGWLVQKLNIVMLLRDANQCCSCLELFNWPANSPDLNPIENLWVLWRGRCDMPDPTMQKSWRSLSEQPGLS